MAPAARALNGDCMGVRNISVLVVCSSLSPPTHNITTLHLETIRRQSKGYCAPVIPRAQMLIHQLLSTWYLTNWLSQTRRSIGTKMIHTHLLPFGIRRLWMARVKLLTGTFIDIDAIVCLLSSSFSSTFNTIGEKKMAINIRFWAQCAGTTRWLNEH